jgi:hypothetical protein
MIDLHREQSAAQENETNKMQEKLKQDFELLSAKLLEEKGEKIAEICIKGKDGRIKVDTKNMFVEE